MKLRFSVDRGGTFTDLYVEGDGVGSRTMKLLSEDPLHYEDAPTEGIRRVLEDVTGKKITNVKDIDTSMIEYIRMGTTVATNALLERQGCRLLLIVSSGFRDVLKIGNQSRPNIFDLKVRKPSVLYEDVVEVDERVRILPNDDECDSDSRVVRGLSGELVEIMKEPQFDEIEDRLRGIREKGISSVAVCLLHSYTFPDHERMIGRFLKEKIGFNYVALSHETLAMVRLVPRGLTTCVDAYLTPLIQQYIESFRSGFSDKLENTNVTFMQSGGGLTAADNFRGSRAIFSGPAGGVVGYSQSVYNEENGQPVIGFDMGGTSTDVSRFDGTFEHVYEVETAGVQIQVPQLDIQTVAAGGGSRLFFRDGLYIVGPESSGANPGPLCYVKNGFLSVTDANVFLGRLIPEYFPHIFGPGQDSPLDYEVTKKAFHDLAVTVKSFYQNQGISKDVSPEEVAYGFVSVANETMCRPIRSMTVAKGYDSSIHSLACFGGAGPQHACAIARALGMKKIYVHRHSSVLSAYGLAMASIVREEQEPSSLVYSSSVTSTLEEKFGTLRKRTKEYLASEGFSENQIAYEEYLNMAFRGTDYHIMTPRIEGETFYETFRKHYKREYGFVFDDRDVLIDDIRVRASGHAEIMKRVSIPKSDGKEKPRSWHNTYFSDGWFKTPVYFHDDLGAGYRIEGPAMIVHEASTILVEPNCTAEITRFGDICISVEKSSSVIIGTDEVDSVAVSIFGHRFMSIAEQMGESLRRTAVSTNIKERLDFSCAIFGPDGGLVSNAPHLPVHLGSMSEAVKWQIEHLGSEWHDGDIILSNHPAASGTHLPDITAIQGVFWEGHDRPVFYVASRGHHADIGGITPGSMPPFSTSLSEEGVHIMSFKIVENGVFNLKGVEDLFNSFGARKLADNISDLQAQVAANQKGITLIQELIQEYSLEVVQAYMKHGSVHIILPSICSLTDLVVQDSAELAVREMLRELVRKNMKVMEHISSTEEYQVSSVDHMDDGTPIALTLRVNPTVGSAVFDFTDTGPQVEGNCNAPRAVTYSAVIYCLRSLVERDIPLNQGCLAPIKILIREGSILYPREGAAVVGGNVLTSQRITDVVLKCFRACAASQGCMNNFTFGDNTFGYYETIAGGSGGGDGFMGQDGVHTHMTNTRITDAEVLEKRYPVLVRRFCLRNGSGGKGKFRGGDGVIREIEFLRPLSVSILSERRKFAPYGLEGGEDGAKGVNIFCDFNGNRKEISGKTTFTVNPVGVFWSIV